jgi:mannosyltransferase OCH1-like enzyme
MNTIIQGLWIGSELSVMERLSIASFLAHEHDYHLYVYDDVKQVPEDATLFDANEIIPRSQIFQYKNSKSYAGFANYFRYKLILERGGWWCDTDVVCLQPFSFPDEYVFCSEDLNGEKITNNGIIKAPRSAPLLDYACRVCRSKDPERLVWGETGPRLLDEAVRRFDLYENVRLPRAFCPLGYLEWERVLDPSGYLVFDESTYAVHLWNEMWRRSMKDKNASFHRNCLYEQLKRKYSVQ